MAAKITETINTESTFSPESGETGSGFKAVDISRESGGVKKEISTDELKEALAKGGLSTETSEAGKASLETDKAVTNPETQALIKELKLTGDPSRDLPTLIDSDTTDFAALNDLATKELFDSDK